MCTNDGTTGLSPYDSTVARGAMVPSSTPWRHCGTGSPCDSMVAAVALVQVRFHQLHRWYPFLYMRNW